MERPAGYRTTVASAGALIPSIGCSLSPGSSPLGQWTMSRSLSTGDVSYYHDGILASASDGGLTAYGLLRPPHRPVSTDGDRAA
jgi:hypothetical protein